MKTPVYLHKPGVVCALGTTTDAVSRALFASEPRPLTTTDAYTPGRELPLGVVDGDLPPLEGRDASRNNRLLLQALSQIQSLLDRQLDGLEPHRVGVVLGTSTSGIGDAEQAFREEACEQLPDWYDYAMQEIGAPAQFLARHLGLSGPATTISTACSSSGKALASARRLLQTGVCDLVICGGVDTLCRLTVNGFGALDSVSERTCNPMSANRDGINIGEAASLFLMSREPAPVVLSGVGESSDAHHISAPHPEGLGALAAMRAALDDAGLPGEEIGYVNLHGTATPQNDSMESRAVEQLLGLATPCSATKPLTGHTLGAAGALEAAFCWLTLTGDGRLPRHWWDGQPDPALPLLSLVNDDTRLASAPRHVLSNSFAFGGNNVALVLSGVDGVASDE
ncbi:beta-ketoacyl-[acyl-carrier-protein] synthase family protein [Marinobacter oulmenensis]|uniref:3-oxoacyl-[acyl-carrier-protein] synthase-1 n=1 Tax=Marinobacter oulmenensis TaxID=643747 RepID=A0A840UGH2_9GAMM|nr:beta-ketoacyl-[acyl-carrier-protein] synthase family protein [Marinobacter oulmenensis]MBB5320266.1 3-oxoacyl-[acyl-carrier-protein] synthase-1 [Marinobacter oulmenensis]